MWVRARGVLAYVLKVGTIRFEKEDWREEKTLEAYTVKRVAAGAHLQTPWFFEPANISDDRAE